MTPLRVLVVLLVLANAALWAWRVQQDTARALAYPPPPPIPASVPRLRLIDELPAPPPPRRSAEPLLLGAQPLPAPAGTASRWATLAAGVRCLRLGPFGDDARAGALGAHARDLGAEPRLVREAHHRARYWWVYLAPAADDAHARGVLASLRERGVGDVMLVQRGPWRGAVSLGAYRSLASVHRRMAELIAAGQHPLALPREFDVTVTWLDLRLREPAALERLRADPALTAAPLAGTCPQAAG